MVVAVVVVRMFNGAFWLITSQRQRFLICEWGGRKAFTAKDRGLACSL